MSNSSYPSFCKKAMNFPIFLQISLLFIIIHVFIISSNPTNSQSLPSDSSPPTDNNNSPEPDTFIHFQPSLAVVIGVLGLMFSLTFILLIYAKWCHRPSSAQYLNQENFGGLPRQGSRVSGIDKTLIESLPFFRFSALKGWRNGLECSICLSRFEDVEVLRLLPKCKHAFHIDCVDRWLEKHSGCPLCRCKVSEEDVTLFAQSSSYRFLHNQSDCDQGCSSLELFVEREGSARFGSRRSVRKIEEEKDQEILEDEEILHKFNHRIIVSEYDQQDFMGKNRWSNLSSSDLLFLKSQMITSLSSNLCYDDGETVASMSSNILDHQVIKVKEEIKKKREFERKIKNFSCEESGMIGSSNEPIKSAKLVEKRSMSEIVVHPRFLGVESSSNEGNLGEISAKEERLKRLWEPIARRTIQMFSNSDQPPQVNTRSQV